MMHAQIWPLMLSLFAGFPDAGYSNQGVCLFLAHCSLQNKVVIFVAADQLYSLMVSPVYYTQVDASISVLMNAHLIADLNDGLCAGAAPPGFDAPSRGDGLW